MPFSTDLDLSFLIAGRSTLHRVYANYSSWALFRFVLRQDLQVLNYRKPLKIAPVYLFPNIRAFVFGMQASTQCNMLMKRHFGENAILFRLCCSSATCKLISLRLSYLQPLSKPARGCNEHIWEVLTTSLRSILTSLYVEHGVTPTDDNLVPSLLHKKNGHNRRNYLQGVAEAESFQVLALRGGRSSHAARHGTGKTLPLQDNNGS